MFKHKKNKELGITLIALVVTIIVLLILAGISIMMLTGDNGILTRAGEAKEEMERVQLEEILKLSIIGGWDKNRLNVAKIRENIKNELPEAEVFGSDFPLIVKAKGRTYKIDGEGTIVAVNMTEDEINELTAGNGIYAKLYNIDNKKVLVIDNNPDFTYNSGTLEKTYNEENQEYLKNENKTVWCEDAGQIDRVIINGAVYPDSTKTWFKDFTKITEIENISKLYTKNITNMSEMFNNCERLENIDLSNFNYNAKNVTSMIAMFRNCKSLKILDLSYLDNNKCMKDEVSGLLQGCNLDELYLCSFPEITDLSYFMPLLCATNTKYINLESMDTSNVTNMGTMFANCSKVEQIDFMRSIDDDVAGVISFSFANVTNTEAMFTGCTNLKTINFGFTAEDNKISNMSGMFNGCKSLTEMDLTPFNNNLCTSTNNVSSMFLNCEKLETLKLCSFKKMKNMSQLVTNMGVKDYLKHLDLSEMDTSETTDMSYMMVLCNKLEDVNLGNINMSKVTNASSMFSSCSSLKTLDLSKVTTSNLIDISSMFQNCTSLESINFNNFNTSSVTNMCAMFNGCSTIEQLDLTSFNTKKATNMKAMFSNAQNLSFIKVGPDWDYDGDGSDDRGNGIFSRCGVDHVTRE